MSACRLRNGHRKYLDPRRSTTDLLEMRRFLTWAMIVALAALLIGLIVTGALLSHRPG
jgi:hypothetical protein